MSKSEPYQVGQFVYRVEWRQWHDDFEILHTSAACNTFVVHSLTPHGAWISYHGENLWISERSRQFKRSPSDAVESTRHRALKWRLLLEGDLVRASARVRYLDDALQVARLVGGAT